MFFLFQSAHDSLRRVSQPVRLQWLKGTTFVWKRSERDVSVLPTYAGTQMGSWWLMWCFCQASPKPFLLCWNGKFPRLRLVPVVAGSCAWRSVQDQAHTSFCRDIKVKAEIDLMLRGCICVFWDFPWRDVAIKSAFSLDMRTNLENSLHGWGFA